MNRAFLIALLLPMVSTATLALGQDGEPAAAEGISRPRQELEYLFYRNIFFRLAPRVPISQGSATTVLDAACSNLSTQLTLQINDINRQISLTQAQKKKLTAAGELDIRRFFVRVEQAKIEYFDTLGDPAKQRVTLAERQHLVGDFEAGIFGGGSFFEKTSKTAIGEKQFDILQASRDRRRRNRWNSKALIIAQAWGDVLGMSDEQRGNFSELIVAEIAPPTRAVVLDYYFILYKLDQLPRDKFRASFDDAQWKAFRQQLSPIKATWKDRLISLGYDLGEAGQAKPEQAK